MPARPIRDCCISLFRSVGRRSSCFAVKQSQQSGHRVFSSRLPGCWARRIAIPMWNDTKTKNSVSGSGRPITPKAVTPEPPWLSGIRQLILHVPGEMKCPFRSAHQCARSFSLPQSLLCRPFSTATALRTLCHKSHRKRSGSQCPIPTLVSPLSCAILRSERKATSSFPSTVTFLPQRDPPAFAFGT